jgi:acid phosphatase
MLAPTILLGFLSAVIAQSDHLQLTSAEDALKKPLTGFSSGSQHKDILAYNYCNMPHVNTLTYQNVSSEDFELLYVELIHRHHKRTQYSSNVLPTDVLETYMNYPQITTGGKIDSIQHGVDLFQVYNGKLGFLSDEYDPETVSYRVTNNNITTQVFNSLILGMYPDSDVEAELREVDNLEPNLKCKQADDLKSSIRQTDLWYQETNSSIYTELGDIYGINATGSPSFFNSIDHFFDNLSSKTCAGDQVNVTSEQYESVIKLGHWEYDYNFRAHPNATEYGKYKYGNFTLELADHLKDAANGERSIKYQHNIAHDGSISGLTALIKDFFGLKEFQWPGMGSEYVFELYKPKDDSDSDHYLRILYGGLEVSFTTLQDFIDYLTEIDTEAASSSCSA